MKTAILILVLAASVGMGGDPNRAVIDSQLTFILETYPAHEGAIIAGQPTLKVKTRPDGIDFANAISLSRGTIWPVDPTTPEGKFTDTDDCLEYIETLCDEAGHGGAEAGTETITTHEDGCRTCSADCNSNGAVAFVTETNCGDDSDDLVT